MNTDTRQGPDVSLVREPTNIYAATLERVSSSQLSGGEMFRQYCVELALVQCDQAFRFEGHLLDLSIF